MIPGVVRHGLAVAHEPGVDGELGCEDAGGAPDDGRLPPVQCVDASVSISWAITATGEGGEGRTA